MTQDDATSRARAHEVIAGLFLGGDIEDLIERRLSDYDRAALLGGLLAREGLAIIDTRTHAAIPREPSEADVERVARAIAERWGASFDFNHYDEEEQASWREQARAAIAALVQEQTQGGERDAPV